MALRSLSSPKRLTSVGLSSQLTLPCLCAMADLTSAKADYSRALQSDDWRAKDPPKTVAVETRMVTAPSIPRGNRPQQSGAPSCQTSRLYVGNLLYQASQQNVEELFTANGFALASISMSLDPFTGRNPSYCFVDLPSSAEAERAMSVINGKTIMGREVKVKPGVQHSDRPLRARTTNYSGGVNKRREELGASSRSYG